MVFKHLISFTFLAILLIQFSAGSLVTCIDIETVEDISNVISDSEEEEETKDKYNECIGNLNILTSSHNRNTFSHTIFQSRYLEKVSIAPPYTPPDLV